LHMPPIHITNGQPFLLSLRQKLNEYRVSEDISSYQVLSLI
jgi:hypothetical protein